MKIYERTYRRERNFVSVHPKNTYKVAFFAHMWLPFIVQPQSDEVLEFSIISFDV